MREHHDTVVIGVAKPASRSARCWSSAKVSMSCWNGGGWVNAGARDDGTLFVFSSPTGRGSCPGDAYLGDDPDGSLTSARSFASSRT
jgi:hypothetical protein